MNRPDVPDGRNMNFFHATGSPLVRRSDTILSVSSVVAGNEQKGCVLSGLQLKAFTDH